jgi:hypothetical protein
MKRLVSFLLIVAILMMFLVSNAFSFDVRANEGYWKLTEVKLDQADEVKSVTISLSQGAASYMRTDEATGDIFAASASWSAPMDEYQGGETVTLTLEASVDTYAWNGDGVNFHGGLNFMGYHVSARFDNPDVPYGFAGNYSIHLVDSDGKNTAEVSATEGKIHQQSTTREVSTQLRDGYRDGEQICLYVSASHTGNVCYLYTWFEQSSETKESTALETSEKPGEKDNITILLSGVVTDVEYKRMPRMRISIDIFTDADSYSPGQPSDIQIKTYTDIDGQFFEQIDITHEEGKEIGIQVKGTLECVLADDDTPFYITNMKYDDSNENISLASFIRIDPEDKRYKNKDVIPVARMFSFYYLISDTWSFDPFSMEYDLLWHNVPDNFELAAASYLYQSAWSAMFYGAVIFDEGSLLKQTKLRIETNWKKSPESNLPDVSHFSAYENTIRLTASDSKFNDNSRHTLLHEYGHFFDAVTNGGKSRAVSLLPAGANSKNHGGYLNVNTADSFMEGFASVYAAFVQVFRKDKIPYNVLGGDLSQPGNFVAWKYGGKSEEWAISTLLYQMYNEYDDKRDFWYILRPNREDFYAYYQAFEEDLKDKPDKLAKLKDAAEKAGLYTMPFGDGSFNKGEPFIDKPLPGSVHSNGERDNGEDFGDLMFAVGDGGWIDENEYLRPFTGDLIHGKSSDALRDRRTSEEFSGSYIYFDSLPADQLLVTISPTDEESVQNLVSVNNNRVYMRLVNRPQEGKVAITVPGGDVIYTGDLAELQDKLFESTGQDVPLAEVSTSNVKWPDSSLWLKPSYGDPDSKVVMEHPEDKMIKKGNTQAVLQKEDISQDVSLEKLADLTYSRSSTDSTRSLYLILIAVLSLILMGMIAALVIVILKGK